MALVLASGSPYRKSLLEKLGLPFLVDPADIDESQEPDEDLEAYVRRLALDKAREVSSRHPASLVIGSDQSCSLNGTRLGKPGNHAAAMQQLRLCSGQWVQFLTSLTLLDTATEENETVVESFDVQFRTLTDREIETYLERDRPYDCAGGFKVEAGGIVLFSELNGRDFHSLIGLPLLALTGMLLARGVNPLLAAD